LSTLTPARRRALYGRVAHAYEEIYENSLEDRLEVLALYYYRSNEQDRALGYLERAGQRAEELDARIQAAQLWRRALKVAEKLGDAEAERRIGERLERLGPVDVDATLDPPDDDAVEHPGGPGA
jgi:tetratricopeptide (TPR) repeat protein